MTNISGFFVKKILNPIKHLIGTTYGYGGNPDEDALCFEIIPVKTDSREFH